MDACRVGQTNIWTMRITLDRLYQSSDCTLGVLSSNDGLLCFTLENPWLDNQVSISCIPEGHYTCKPHNGRKYQNTWEVTSVSGRSAILFHSGNVEKDTRGCILPGLTKGVLNGKRAVLGSRLAMEKLRDYIGINKTFDLNIRRV